MSNDDQRIPPSFTPSLKPDSVMPLLPLRKKPKPTRGIARNTIDAMRNTPNDSAPATRTLLGVAFFVLFVAVWAAVMGFLHAHEPSRARAPHDGTAPDPVAARGPLSACAGP